MIYIQWVLVAIIMAIGLFGGYYQLLIVAHMKEGTRASALIGGWLFYPEHLDEIGKAYRKKIIVCWVVALALAIIWVQIVKGL